MVSIKISLQIHISKRTSFVVIIKDCLQVILHSVTSSCDGLAAAGAAAVVQSVEALLAEKVTKATLHYLGLMGHVLKTNGAIWVLGLWSLR